MDPHTFVFDLDVYRLSAIKKASYRYLDKCKVQIECLTDRRVQVRFEPLGSVAIDLQGFPGEVLDQDLRELVAEETKPVRDLLLAQAFSGLSLVDPIGESADFRQDPLGIAEPTRGVDDVAG